MDRFAAFVRSFGTWRAIRRVAGPDTHDAYPARSLRELALPRGLTTSGYRGVRLGSFAR